MYKWHVVLSSKRFLSSLKKNLWIIFALLLTGVKQYEYSLKNRVLNPSSSFVCHSSPLSVISTPPLTLYSFLYSSHISFQILPNFHRATSESLAVLITFSHGPLSRCYRAIKNNRRTNHTAVEQRSGFIEYERQGVSI